MNVIHNDQAGIGEQKQLQDGGRGSPTQPPPAALAHTAAAQVLTASDAQTQKHNVNDKVKHKVPQTLNVQSERWH